VSDYDPIIDFDFDPIAVMLDPSSSADDVKLAVAIAPWPELVEARRRLRLLRGGHQAALDQIEQELRDLERRHPGIEDA
jgi:hypothetical protein